MNATTSSVLLVLVASFIGSFGAVLLKAGSMRVKRGLRDMVLNPRILLGCVTYVLSSFFFILAIRQGELSILYPMVALSYVWTMLWAKIFFDEPFTRNKFAGIALILTGVALLNVGRG
ncbi:MAG: EamA family transporter [Bryobacterales bacterium]|nr:EamA family transporter [Bryobacterales bacterium]